MSRYIDEDRLKDHFKCMIRQLNGDTRIDFKNTNNLVIKTLERVCKDIDNEKTADVAPVVHAHWDEEGNCSHCGTYMEYQANYCPHCGAKMDEKKENK